MDKKQVLGQMRKAGMPWEILALLAQERWDHARVKPKASSTLINLFWWGQSPLEYDFWGAVYKELQFLEQPKEALDAAH